MNPLTTRDKSHWPNTKEKWTNLKSRTHTHTHTRTRFKGKVKDVSNSSSPAFSLTGGVFQDSCPCFLATSPASCVVYLWASGLFQSCLAAAAGFPGGVYSMFVFTLLHCWCSAGNYSWLVKSKILNLPFKAGGFLFDAVAQSPKSKATQSTLKGFLHVGNVTFFLNCLKLIAATFSNHTRLQTVKASL